MTTTTAARTPAIDASIDGTVITLAFSNGQRIILDAATLTDGIRTQAMMHGLKQKLVDAAAISRNTDTGRSATIEDKFDAVDEVHARLVAGQWNKNRDAGAVRGGLLFRALCMMYPDKTVDALRGFLEKKTPAEKAALRNTPKIAAIIATLKEDEVDTDGVDTDALLGELDA